MPGSLHRLLLGLLIVTCYAVAQPPASAPQRFTFDVASVKPTVVPDGITAMPNGSFTVRRGSNIAVPRNTGGPGTSDPGRIHYPLISLKTLVSKVYDSDVEIVCPDWMDSTFVDIEATMPPATTNGQFREMLLNLLRERFQFKAHREDKDVSGYALVIAKGGPKLTPSAPVPPPPTQADGTPTPPTRPRERGPDGFMIVSREMLAGHGFHTQGLEGGRNRLSAVEQTMQNLADQLARVLGSKIIDATSLPGQFDITLTYTGASPFRRAGEPPAPPPSTTVASDPSPDIFAALQSQLGLKLEAKKLHVPSMVVDHMEKRPAGN
jgi:uncharacterized protein (TIGR03435 family)